jgi:hypothetical protein
MENLKKRLLAIFCMVAISVCLAVAQTNTIKHVVDRGETLASIAQRYSTTEAKIIELNPDAAQFVYVGMELIIPVSATSQSGNVVNQKTSEATTVSTTSYSQEYQSADDYEGTSRTRFAIDIGYGFLDDGFAYQFTVGANYTAIADLYVGGKIGYNSANYQGDRTTTTSNLLMIPIEAGYVFANSNRNLAISPHLGFDFNIGLSGKYKDERNPSQSSKLKIGGKFGVDFKIGVRINLYGFIIGGGYHMPLNNRQKKYFGTDAYPEISIGGEI